MIRRYCPHCGGTDLVIEYGTRGVQSMYQTADGWWPSDHEVIGHSRTGDLSCEGCGHRWRGRVPAEAGGGAP